MDWRSDAGRCLVKFLSLNKKSPNDIATEKKNSRLQTSAATCGHRRPSIHPTSPVQTGFQTGHLSTLGLPSEDTQGLLKRYYFVELYKIPHEYPILTENATALLLIQRLHYESISLLLPVVYLALRSWRRLPIASVRQPSLLLSSKQRQKLSRPFSDRIEANKGLGKKYKKSNTEMSRKEKKNYI